MNENKKEGNQENEEEKKEESGYEGIKDRKLQESNER